MNGHIAGPWQKDSYTKGWYRYVLGPRPQGLDENQRLIASVEVAYGRVFLLVWPSPWSPDGEVRFEWEIPVAGPLSEQAAVQAAMTQADTILFGEGWTLAPPLPPHPEAVAAVAAWDRFVEGT